MSIFGTTSFQSSSASSIYKWPSNNPNPNKDIEIQSPPDDSISALRWSPNAMFLVAGSWNNTVSVSRIISTQCHRHFIPVHDCL